MAEPGGARFDPTGTYDRAAEDYEVAAQLFWQHVSIRSVERLGLQRGERVLDVPCGTGSALPAAGFYEPLRSIFVQAVASVAPQIEVVEPWRRTERASTLRGLFEGAAWTASRSWPSPTGSPFGALPTRGDWSWAPPSAIPSAFSGTPPRRGGLAAHEVAELVTTTRYAVARRRP